MTLSLDQVYFIRGDAVALVKIGRTRNTGKRLVALQTGSPDKLSLLGILQTDNAAELERTLHRRFARDRAHGEWFRIGDALAKFIDQRVVYKPRALRKAEREAVAESVAAARRKP